MSGALLPGARLGVLLGALSACVAEVPALDTGTAPVDDAPFEILADNVPGGVLLSAASVGTRMLLVGGPMDDGPGMVAWYNGSTLCTEATPPSHTLWWAMAPSATEWWAVGKGGLVVHDLDGVRTEEILDPELELFGVWDDGETVWAVGQRGFFGEIWRYDGTWTVAKSEVVGPVFKVWDGWFVGDGSILHLEDGAIVDDSIWPPPRLVTVRGRAEEEVWAVGGVGDATFMRWDGTSWAFDEIDRACAPAPLNGVWTAPGEGIWIAGNSGTMAGFDGTNWTCPLVARTNNPFHSVWKHGESVYFLGGNMFDDADWHGTLARYGTEPLSADLTTCE